MANIRASRAFACAVWREAPAFTERREMVLRLSNPSARMESSTMRVRVTTRAKPRFLDEDVFKDFIKWVVVDSDRGAFRILKSGSSDF